MLNSLGRPFLYFLTIARGGRRNLCAAVGLNTVVDLTVGRDINKKLASWTGKILFSLSLFCSLIKKVWAGVTGVCFISMTWTGRDKTDRGALALWFFSFLFCVCLVFPMRACLLACALRRGWAGLEAAVAAG